LSRRIGQRVDQCAVKVRLHLRRIALAGPFSKRLDLVTQHPEHHVRRRGDLEPVAIQAAHMNGRAAVETGERAEGHARAGPHQTFVGQYLAVADEVAVDPHRDRVRRLNRRPGCFGQLADNGEHRFGGQPGNRLERRVGRGIEREAPLDTAHTAAAVRFGTGRPGCQRQKKQRQKRVS
jgi:hypothetical protein